VTRLFHRPARYGTAEAALILDTEQWRVKNFALPAYGIEPTVKASGRGSRRYYGFDAVLRLAVANELYDVFLSPDGIKGAIAAIESHKSIQKWVDSYDERGNAPSLMLILSDGKNKETGKWERVWKVLDLKSVKGDFVDRLKSGSVAVSLNLIELWESVVKRITELEGKGSI
jgi:hypothetical protein